MRRAVLILVTIICIGCAKNNGLNNSDVILFDDLRINSVFAPQTMIDSIRYVILLNTCQQNMISWADKIVVNDSSFHVLDMMNRKIVRFSLTGEPDYVLSRRGRGPGEYIQITDFDIDNEGGIWILDGNKDICIHYSPAGEHISTTKLKFEAEFIKVVNANTFFFGLCPWDKLYNKGKIAITDRSMNISAIILAHENNTDKNYSFPSIGFVSDESLITYHRPIDDNLYLIDNSGTLKETVHFDFGIRTVPDKIRTGIEKYRDKFEFYNTLVKLAYANESFIIGSVMKSNKIEDFIIDRKDKEIYMQETHDKSFILVGLSSGQIIYKVQNTESMPSFVPNEVREALNEGKDVFAFLPL